MVMLMIDTSLTGWQIGKKVQLQAYSAAKVVKLDAACVIKWRKFDEGILN
jgi:hypothetical protein